jgi:hypothetical protein
MPRPRLQTGVCTYILEFDALDGLVPSLLYDRSGLHGRPQDLGGCVGVLSLNFFAAASCCMARTGFIQICWKEGLGNVKQDVEVIFSRAIATMRRSTSSIKRSVDDVHLRLRNYAATLQRPQLIREAAFVQSGK